MAPVARLMTVHCPVDPAAPVLRSTPDIDIEHVTVYVGSVIQAYSVDQ